MARPARSVGAALLLAASSALAEGDTFLGWSKDGTWLVFESKGLNDAVEVFFCATGQGANPTWPAALNDMDRADERTLSCVRFVDPNRMPLDWQKLLVLPAPSMQSGALRVLPELVGDGDAPGFMLEAGGKKQVCVAASVREDSRLGAVWWHPNGKWVAAVIDGALRHCAVTLKAPAGKGKKK